MSTGCGHRRTRWGPAGPEQDPGKGPAEQGTEAAPCPPPSRWSPHAKLLMSLGPWPALKESRVLKMVMRKEGKATAQAAVKFLGAYGGRWAGLAEAGIPPQGPAHLHPLPTCPPVPSAQDLMTQNGISYVLNASNSCPKPDFICESRFMRIPINDNYCEKLLPWLDKSIEFIGESGVPLRPPFLGGRVLRPGGSRDCW